MTGPPDSGKAEAAHLGPTHEFAAAIAASSTATIPRGSFEPVPAQLCPDSPRQVVPFDPFDPWGKCQRLLESDDYPTLEQIEDAVFFPGRNYGPGILWELYCAGYLVPRDAQQLVPDVWQMVEFPLLALDREQWAELFTRCGGYLHNGVRRARPRLPRTLFRGADPEYRDGWSWSDDRARAQWFADRFPGGVLWTAHVEPARLLARITEGRCESEYAVNTDGLTITAAGGAA